MSILLEESLLNNVGLGGGGVMESHRDSRRCVDIVADGEVQWYRRSLRFFYQFLYKIFLLPRFV